MTHAQERQIFADLSAALREYEEQEGPLGTLDGSNRESFILQMVDSVRRNRFFDLLVQREQGPRSADVSDMTRFDPLRAALYQRGRGDNEEAFWLVFLATHFGKHRRAGWEYARRVYGALETDHPWTWVHVSEAPEEFREWLDRNASALRADPGGFGNHRKFESLSGRSENGTGAVVASYVNWSGRPPSQVGRIAELVAAAHGSPVDAFDRIYRSLSEVERFGRLAKFDYLNNIRRLGFAEIRPGKVYFQGASGPLIGARLLWGDAESAPAAAWYEAKVSVLDSHLKVGADVIEDALCNWQKSPGHFKRFSG